MAMVVKKSIGKGGGFIREGDARGGIGLGPYISRISNRGEK